MSNSSAQRRQSPTESTDGSVRPTNPARRAHLLRKPVEAVGFWAAIGLPFLYLPLLLSGPQTSAERSTVFGLMALHAVAILIGHTHRQSARAD